MTLSILPARGPILVTGAAGLIGSVLCAALTAAGYQVRGLDLRAQGAWQGDICDPQRLRTQLQGCQGIVHLAAVSRVLQAEQDPARCWQVNVDALARLLAFMPRLAPGAWLIAASSREVYGDAAQLPVVEAQPLRPRNLYARSKVAGEALVADAAAKGLRAMTVRFSNVYGRVSDYPDRVIPAFVRAVLAGTPMRLDGPDHSFDFTQVDDVVSGLLLLVAQLQAGAVKLPTLHFVSGEGTSLATLAQLIQDLAGRQVVLHSAPPSQLHVQRFVGDGTRAAQVLGWRPTRSLRAGLALLLAAHQAAIRRIHSPAQASHSGELPVANVL